MSVPKRSERDSSLYAQINNLAPSQFDKDINYFIKKDPDYYQAIKETINSNLVQRSLYATTALSAEQKYVRMHEQIQRWMFELNEMINQVDSDHDNSLAKSEWYLQNDQNLTDIYAKVIGTDSDYELNEKLADEFASHYKQRQLVDAEVWTRKSVDYTNNEQFKNYLKQQSDLDKAKLGLAKRNLEKYKIKWIWYLIPVLALFIGAILCIILPAVL